MTEVYKNQVNDLELIVPNFKVCSAIIHYDETSPHMHIVGVPIKYNCKTGMSMQVGKTDVFTKTSLKELQDKMRTLCIEEYNKEYDVEATLKKKLKGRNIDIHVSDMIDYQETKKQIEKHQKNIDSINEKSIELENESNAIRETISNLKKTPLIKDSYLINSEDKTLIESHLDKMIKVNKEYRNIKELSSSLKELDSTIKKDKKTIKTLTENNKALELRVETLTERIEYQEDKIDELKSENFNLKLKVQQLEEIFRRLINMIKNMFKLKDKRNNYIEVANDLYEHRIINNKTMNELEENLHRGTKEKDELDL